MPKTFKGGFGGILILPRKIFEFDTWVVGGCKRYLFAFFGEGLVTTALRHGRFRRVIGCPAQLWEVQKHG